jgi:hypothetical protein
MNIVKSVIFLSLVFYARSDACTVAQIEDLGNAFQNAQQNMPQDILTPQQFYAYVVSLLSPEQQAYPCLGCLQTYVVGVYDWAMSGACVDQQASDQCMSQFNNLLTTFTECATDSKDAPSLGGALTVTATLAASMVLLH